MSSITGIAAALPIGQARFDRAAARVTAAASDEAVPTPTSEPRSAPPLSDAMVEMTTARYAFQASLRAAMQSNAMMLQAINLGE